MNEPLLAILQSLQPPPTVATSLPPFSSLSVLPLKDKWRRGKGRGKKRKKLLLVYFRYFEGENSNIDAPIECHYRALDVSVMRLSAELENFTHASCLTQSGLRGVSLREIKSTSHSESLFFSPALFS